MKIIPLQLDGKTPLADPWTLDAGHREGVFGRGEDAAFRLDDGSLSLHHAHLSWQSGTLVVRDLDSINGLSRGGRKVRRAEFSGEGMLAAGNVILRILPERGDAAARFRSRLMRFALVLATVAVALVVVKIVSEYAADHAPAEEAEEEQIVPIEPAPPSPEQREQISRIEKSRALVEKAVDDLSNGEPPEGVARDLIAAIRLYDDPSGRAQTALTGLQARYAAPHLEEAAAAAKKRDYPRVDAEIAAAEVYYAEPPEEVQSIRALVDSQRAFEKTIRLMQDGKTADAETLAETIDPALVPEAEELKEQIAMALRARKWAESFSASVRAGDPAKAEKLLEEEGKWVSWLTPPDRKEFGARKDALRYLEKLLAMYENGDVHDLLVLDPDDHGLEVIKEAQEKLGELCRTRTEEDLALLEEAEKAAGNLAEPPADEAEAGACLDGELPAARLYWGGGRTQEAKERFFAFHGRWVEYVQGINGRAKAFLDLGARDQARLTLEKILPHIMDDSPGVEEITAMADDLEITLPTGTR
jgi:hypothetical protein